MSKFFFLLLVASNGLDLDFSLEIFLFNWLAHRKDTTVVVNGYIMCVRVSVSVYSLFSLRAQRNHDTNFVRDVINWNNENVNFALNSDRCTVKLNIAPNTSHPYKWEYTYVYCVLCVGIPCLLIAYNFIGTKLNWQAPYISLGALVFAYDHIDDPHTHTKKNIH